MACPHRLSTFALSTLSAALGAALLLAAGPSLAATDGPFAETARELTRKLEKAGVKSVAVVDFFDLKGRETELGRFLADELSAAMVATDSPVKVIDRLRLATILKERKLSATGLLDEDNARKVGRIAGVDVLITGRLTSFDEVVRVSLVGLRVPSAEVLVSEPAEVPRTPRIAELESRSLVIDYDPETGHREISFKGSPEQRYTVDEYEFELLGCTRIGVRVHCGITVLNRGDERNQYLSGKTRMVLDRGVQLQASRVGFGENWATGELSVAGSYLPKDLPVPIVVMFEGVPEGVSTIPELELDLRGFYVPFRKIPLGDS